MKRTPIIAAVTAAAGSVLLMHLYLQHLEAEVGGGPKLPVLIATGDIPIGTTLSEKSLGIRDLPRAYVEARHVKATELKTVLGARTVAGLKANEVLLWSDVGRFNDQSRFLSTLIQNGMRAVAIDGRSIHFEGLLRPGDRVDVLLTVADRDGTGGSTVTLLQNLLVLSVGGDTTRESGRNNPGNDRGSLTLSATVEQAQKLTQGAQRGRLTLTLRNADDIAILESVPGTTSADLMESKDTPARNGRTATKEVIERVR